MLLVDPFLQVVRSVVAEPPRGPAPKRRKRQVADKAVAAVRFNNDVVVINTLQFESVTASA